MFLGVSTAVSMATKQIFLSYGRRDASAIAEEVAAFLGSRGFRVWQDRPEIKPGVPFLEKIEEAIHQSDVMVALLSPHSVRRAGEFDDFDSVCLDELSLARFSKPTTPIEFSDTTGLGGLATLSGRTVTRRF